MKSVFLFFLLFPPWWEKGRYWKLFRPKGIATCLKGKHHPGHKIEAKQNRSRVYINGLTLTTALSDYERKQPFTCVTLYTVSTEISSGTRSVVGLGNRNKIWVFAMTHRKHQFFSASISGNFNFSDFGGSVLFNMKKINELWEIR